LALETPQGDLVEGMKLRPGTFAPTSIDFENNGDQPLVGRAVE